VHLLRGSGFFGIGDDLDQTVSGHIRAGGLFNGQQDRWHVSGDRVYPTSFFMPEWISRDGEKLAGFDRDKVAFYL
jgi:hypothetical protein